ncbi:MAG: amidase family protein [Pseudomonadota bacterium]
MDSWRRMGAMALGQGIEAGEIDPRDLAETFLSAIESHPDQALIYARRMPDRARAEAAAARERQVAGTRLSPLDGVPISWKDNFDTAGVATEGGSRLLAGRVPEVDAVCLTQATGAGLVCLGKTHLSELAFSGLGLNPMTATPPNAVDRRRVPGGSSSGAATSTMAGLAAAGIGSDTGGSVRIPAAWNDMVGLKTTWGALSNDGVIPLSRSFDTPGPLTRDVADAALLYGAMRGEAPSVPEAHLPSALLVPNTHVLDDMDPEVAAEFEATLGRLSSAGIAVAQGPAPELSESAQLLSERGGLLGTEVWQEWGALIDANPMTMFHQIETRFRGNSVFTAEDAAHSREVQARLRDSLVARIEAQGFLAMPTSPILPPFVSKLLADPEYYTARNLLGLRNTRQGNLLGLCSITLPTRTPMVGLMLMAGPGQEDALLAASLALEPLLR